MTLSLNVVGVAQYITIHSLKPQFYETETASGYRALKVSSNLEKFPSSKCASCNRALKFMGNFRKIS